MPSREKERKLLRKVRTEILAGDNAPIPASVTTFVNFIGWGRSGHSFIGQALNAHRNCLLANEGLMFPAFKAAPSRDHVFAYLSTLDGQFGRRKYRKKPQRDADGNRKGGVQRLRVKGGYQGVHEDLRAIGNSKAAGCVDVIVNEPQLFDKFVDTMRLDMKFVLVTRHPREIIASSVKRTGRPMERAVARTIANTVEVETAIQRLSARFQILEIAHEDFVDDPEAGARTLFEFAGLPADPALANAIAEATYKKAETPSASMPAIREFDDVIARAIKRYDFFRRYREPA